MTVLYLNCMQISDEFRVYSKGFCDWVLGFPGSYANDAPWLCSDCAWMVPGLADDWSD